MADYHCRAMQKADIPAALALWRGTDGLALDAADEPGALAAFLDRNPQLSGVVLDGGCLIATLLCGEDGRRATLYHLCVAAAYRGQHIGRRLLQRVEEQLRCHGIGKMRLLVLGDNTGGNAYWQAHGWQRQTTLNYYSKTL